ncbi:unnamed protein product [Bathycoccus prasinos]
MNAAEKSNAQLPMQSQRAVEDFLEQLLREKGAHGIVKEQQTNNDVLFATAKTFLENAIVRCVVGTTNTTSEGGGGGDLNNDDDEAIVHALHRVKAVLNERIRGRTNADVILLNAVDRSIVVAKEELIAFREEKKKKQTTTTKKGLNNNESSFKVYKQNVISAIREMIASDVDQAKRAIGEYACETCGSDCVVMVLGVRDGLVENFLKMVARKRRVKVIVLEKSVSYEESGKAMAEEFARKILMSTNTNNSNNNNNKETTNSAVEVTIVPESNAFAMMSRAHLAVVSAQLGVFEDGSFYAPPGTGNIARACEKFKVPLVALAPSLSLTTLEKPRIERTNSSNSSNHNSNNNNDNNDDEKSLLLSRERNGNPAEVLKHFRARSAKSGRDVDAVAHPTREFIDLHEKIDLAFVTDHGIVAPKNLKRLARELYSTP